jgi:trehalose 6-phosphate phosphatase
MHELLEPLLERPQASGILLDIDGTLAPIVPRAEDASVPLATRDLLAALSTRYCLVACLSGRRAVDARRIVGLDSITYVGNHGLEYLRPGAEQPETPPELARHAARVDVFAAGAFTSALRELGVRLEDKRAIWSFHWREAPDVQAARERLERVAAEARKEGLVAHWGRKVLEIRPPLAHDKGVALESLVRAEQLERVLYVGDDTTDLDAFRKLRELRAAGTLAHAVCIGVASEEAPAELVEEADALVQGPEGVAELIRALAKGPAMAR